MFIYEEMDFIFLTIVYMYWILLFFLKIKWILIILKHPFYVVLDIYTIKMCNNVNDKLVRIIILLKRKLIEIRWMLYTHYTVHYELLIDWCSYLIINEKIRKIKLNLICPSYIY